MRKTGLEIAGYLTISIVVILGMLAILHMIIALPIRENKGPEWVGAIGTVGAFAGTIWLAMAENRKRNREARDLATVTAAAINPRLIRLRRVVEIAIRQINSADEEGQYRVFKKTVQMLESVRIWDAEDLIALVPLGNHTAAKLAMAAAVIERASKSLKGYVIAGGGAPSEYRGNVCKHLGRALEALRHGKLECDKLLTDVQFKDL